MIEKAKIGALESSVNGLVESANMYYANNTIKGETVGETTFDFEDGEQVSKQKLEYKGKVYNGKLILHANGEVAVCIDDEEHYAYKNKDRDEIVSGNGTCVYDGTTGDFSSNSGITDLRGKTLAAATIEEIGKNALITIPEEGHYDGTSKISIPIETIKNNVNVNKTFFEHIYMTRYSISSYDNVKGFYIHSYVDDVTTANINNIAIQYESMWFGSGVRDVLQNFSYSLSNGRLIVNNSGGTDWNNYPMTVSLCTDATLIKSNVTSSTTNDSAQTRLYVVPELPDGLTIDDLVIEISSIYIGSSGNDKYWTLSYGYDPSTKTISVTFNTSFYIYNNNLRINVYTRN